MYIAKDLRACKADLVKLNILYISHYMPLSSFKIHHPDLVMLDGTSSIIVGFIPRKCDFIRKNLFDHKTHRGSGYIQNVDKA